MAGKTYHLLVNLTWRCQNQCSYCWEVLMGRNNGGKPYNAEEQDWETWLNVLNRLPPSVLDLSGGEPTLLEGFDRLVRGLDGKHLIALSTNLRGNAVHKIRSCESRFFGINCSWHRDQGLSLETFTKRVVELMSEGFPVSVNIVEHLDSVDSAAVELLNDLNVPVHISPFENPLELCETDLTLKCNAGLNTFCVDPCGDVYRCLTWFRYSGRRFGYLGNMFKGTFSPLSEIAICNLKCDIYYILDPKHHHKHIFSTYVRRV